MSETDVKSTPFFALRLPFSQKNGIIVTFSQDKIVVQKIGSTTPCPCRDHKTDSIRADFHASIDMCCNWCQNNHRRETRLMMREAICNGYYRPLQTSHIINLCKNDRLTNDQHSRTRKTTLHPSLSMSQGMTHLVGRRGSTFQCRDI